MSSRQRDGEPEILEDVAHPLRVAPGQVVVDGDEVRAAAGQRVQIERQRGDECLALTGRHFGDAPAVQHDAADELHVVGNHVPGELVPGHHAPWCPSACGTPRAPWRRPRAAGRRGWRPAPSSTAPPARGSGPRARSRSAGSAQACLAARTSSSSVLSAPVRSAITARNFAVWALSSSSERSLRRSSSLVDRVEGRLDALPLALEARAEYRGHQ